MKTWIGLDIGGTRLKGGALDDRGCVIARSVESTHPGQSLRVFERQINTLVGRLDRRAGGGLAGIGVAITGPVDSRIGCVYLPGKIRGLDRRRTIPHLRRRWRVPVNGDNDGRLACYAEWRAGAGRGVKNLVVFTLGTGIGSGVVFDGHLLRDRHFHRGTQCGHMIIDLNGPRCLTGAAGTGESLASVTALVQSACDPMTRGPETSIAGRQPAEITFPDVVAAVRRRDRVMCEVFDRWLKRFTAVVLYAYYAYTPDLILLAGRPVEAAAIFFRKLEARLNATAFRVPVGYRIPVRAARQGSGAGWIGGALMARESFGGGA